MRTLPTRAARAAVALPVLFAAACAVSTQQEVALGTSYATEIAKELPLVQDPEVNRYITLLGDSLATVADRRNLDWHFAIVDSKEVNAFAVPGGFIYVNRGLLERSTTMAQVAGVIGHEIGHVTRRHSIKQMQKQEGTNIGATLLCTLTAACNSQAAQTGISLAANAAFAKFSRTDEAEADEEGVRFLIRSRIDPNGIPEMFAILLNERKQQPDAVSSFFLSHPLEESRIADTKRLIATYPRDMTTGLTRDTPNFQSMKRRLQSLPVTAKK